MVREKKHGSESARERGVCGWRGAGVLRESAKPGFSCREIGRYTRQKRVEEYNLQWECWAAAMCRCLIQEYGVGERRRVNGNVRGFRAREPTSSHYSNPGWGSGPSDQPKKLGRREARGCVLVLDRQRHNGKTLMDIDQGRYGPRDMVHETDVEGSSFSSNPQLVSSSS